MNMNLFSLKTKIIIFFVNLITLLIIGYFQYKNQFNILRDDFNFQVENIIKSQFSNDISSTNAVVNTLSSFYHSIEEVNTSIFSKFSKDLISKYDFIDNIAFSIIVKHKQREEFEKSMQDTGFYDFKIKSYSLKESKLIKSENKKLYAPIIYMEPASYKYTRYHGFDIYNSPVFHDSFQKAIKDDKPVIKDRFKNDKNDLMNIFIKATYDDVQSKNPIGFFLIDLNIEKILESIRIKLQNYEIKIVDIKDYPLYLKQSLENENSVLKDLIYLSKLEGFSSSYLYIKKDLTATDFNIKLFLMIIFLVVIIQVLFVITWHRDKFAKNKLSYRASHDDLTGLINRLYFRKSFEEIIKESKQVNSDLKTAILFIDLDRFKELNDSFGHEIGDKALVEIASRFKKVVSSNDIVCRHGGDEFIILIDNIEHIKELIKTINKVMSVMNEPIICNNHRVYLTLSIGISLYPNDGITIDDLLKNADSALYKAKDEGRNTFRFYTEKMTEEVMQKIVLENKLREAIEEDEFVVYYQPQFDGRDDGLVGMEALVRWQDKKDGLISPAKFIPLAEETGLIIKLDQLIMRKAIKQFSIWQKRGLSTGTLSLNLSMKQLKSSNFISILKESLLVNNCSANLIELEITESQIMENPNEAIEKLKELSSLGIKLSVDDFGTGYSSLAYLKKLPIHKLKIDRAFVMDLPDDEEDIAISKSIISLSKNLKLDVIAEGVETIEQRDFLVDNGCNKIQGFYYSKPLNTSDMENLLNKIG